MPVQKILLIAFCHAVVVLPLVVLAASASQHEFADATRVTPNTEHGTALFQTCAKCHGADGGGSRAVGTPAIAGQHFRVLAKQLVDYQRDKRFDIRMEQIAKQHDLQGAQAIADVATYVSKLEWKAAGGIGDGELVAHGEEVYVQSCRSCHGAEGDGDATAFVPRVAGQHYGYVLREMHDAVEGRRPNFSIRHIRLLQKLDHDDFVGVADFLSRMDPSQDRSQIDATH
jgi:cytochrome c553